MRHSRTDPPRLFLRFFRWFCHPELKKYIEGDLLELYHERLKQSQRRADLNFIIDVMLLFRPGIIKPTSNTYPLNSFAMFKSYLVIGIRNLFKNSSYSIINIGGLTLGLLVVCLIGLWVYDELTFNQQHENYPRIVQIMKGGTFDGKFYSGQRHLPYPLINELKDSYGSNFKHIVPSSGPWEYTITSGEKVVSALGSYVGSGAPEMYSFKMRHGTRNGLKQPDGIMISASVATSLFGDADPINKQVVIGDNEVATVAGVFEDFPINSSLNGMKFFGTWEKYLISNPWVTQQNWENHFLMIYAEINPALTEEQVAENIRKAELKAIEGLDDMKGSLKFNPMVMIHPMRDWHLRSDFNQGVLETGPEQFVWYMGFIGIFVLVLACINFMNLSTARSEKRAREVGVRKTMGSVRFQLISQFYAESFLIVFCAYLLAFTAVVLVLPLFNDLTGKSISIPVANINFWLVSVLILFVTSFLSGSYPALYLSSFQPVQVLKGTLRAGRNASTPRRVLVVLQFTISVMLIICTVVVHNQLFFAKDRPVGYQREGLMMIQKKSAEQDKQYDAFAAELKNTGAVLQVCQSGGKVTEVWSGNGGFSWKGMPQGSDDGFSTLAVSHDFGKTVGWMFIAGRDFSVDMASDSSAFVINEAAAKVFGFKNPVGETVRWTNRAYQVDKQFQVIGVIKDMVMDSPFDPVEPAVYFVNGYKGWINLRIAPTMAASDAIAKIDGVFKKLFPSVPFDYKFADEQFGQKFKAEENIGQLASVFSALAVIISCLGLFGLASFVAEQRTKELGIRKILGANIGQLWRLISTDFLLLVLIACAISIPVSFMVMDNWLTQYQYRTSLSWEIFAGVTVAAVLITLLTVSYQAIRAALANPVKSLRSE